MDNKQSDQYYYVNDAFQHFASLARSAYVFNAMSGMHKDTTKSGIENQIKLIEEETNELREGFEAGSTVEILDACIDILYVTYGLLQKLEKTCYVDSAIYQVHTDNFKKFFSPDEYAVAMATADKHKEDGKDCTIIKNEDFNLYAVVNHNNKVLKPIDFVSTDLTEFVMEGHREIK